MATEGRHGKHFAEWPEKVGKGLTFVSLNVEPPTYEGEVAALDALRAEPEAGGVSVKDGTWGYRLLVVDDPDGNQLFFNCTNEPAQRAAVPVFAYISVDRPGRWAIPSPTSSMACVALERFSLGEFGRPPEGAAERR